MLNKTDIKNYISIIRNKYPASSFMKRVVPVKWQFDRKVRECLLFPESQNFANFVTLEEANAIMYIFAQFYPERLEEIEFGVPHEYDYAKNILEKCYPKLYNIFEVEGLI